MLFRSPISTAPRRRRVLPDVFRFSIYHLTERRRSDHLDVPIYLAVQEMIVALEVDHVRVGALSSDGVCIGGGSDQGKET